MAFFDRNIALVEEAARVDGATRLQTFLRITLPVAAPGILAAGLLSFILSWNEFLFALILSGPQTNTLPVGLSSFQTHRGVDNLAFVGGDDLRDSAGLRTAALHEAVSDQGLSLGALK